MREQLDKKQEDLGGLASESGSRIGPGGIGSGGMGSGGIGSGGIGSGGIGAGSGSQQRRESIWNGLAEIWIMKTLHNSVFYYHEWQQ